MNCCKVLVQFDGHVIRTWVIFRGKWRFLPRSNREASKTFRRFEETVVLADNPMD